MYERKDKTLQYHGKEAPDNWLDIFCFSWNRSTSESSVLFHSHTLCFQSMPTEDGNGCANHY